jgi:hypothetical protein
MQPRYRVTNHNEVFDDMDGVLLTPEQIVYFLNAGYDAVREDFNDDGDHDDEY